jgi:hypothetical protein
VSFSREAWVRREREREVFTSMSGLQMMSSRIKVPRIAARNPTVRTWMMASKMDMFFVVRSTWKPAATSGVTCSKAALISREYGIPIVAARVGLGVGC